MEADTGDGGHGPEGRGQAVGGSGRGDADDHAREEAQCAGLQALVESGLVGKCCFDRPHRS